MEGPGRCSRRDQAGAPGGTGQVLQEGPGRFSRRARAGAPGGLRVAHSRGRSDGEWGSLVQGYPVAAAVGSVGRPWACATCVASRREARRQHGHAGQHLWTRSPRVCFVSSFFLLKACGSYIQSTLQISLMKPWETEALQGLTVMLQETQAPPPTKKNKNSKVNAQSLTLPWK